MPLVVIRDSPASFEFYGSKIAGVSTGEAADGSSRLRWFEAVLYRKDDGSGYVLHQVNYSRVWHLDGYAGDHVRKPGEARRDALPPDAVYCGTLKPGPDRPQCPRAGRQGPPLPPGALVVTESPQHRVIAYPDATVMIENLMTARRADGSKSVVMSGPMGELLDEAAGSDPAVAAARPVIRLLCILLETAQSRRSGDGMSRTALANRIADGTRLPPPAPPPEDDYEQLRRAGLRTRLIQAGVPLIEADTDRDILSDLAREIEIYLRGLTIAQLACLTHGHKWPELIPIPGAKAPKGFRVVPATGHNGVYLVTERCTRRIVIGAGRGRDISECGTVRKSQTLPPGESGIRGLFDRGHKRNYAYDDDVWEKRPEGSKLTRIDFLDETCRRMSRQLFPAEYDGDDGA